MGDEEKDDSYCGVGKFATGKWDPFQEACDEHDPRYDKHKRGEKTTSNWVTQRDFSGKVIRIAAMNVAKAVYSVGMLPVYLLGGAVGGAVRWWWITPGKETVKDAQKVLVDKVQIQNLSDEIKQQQPGTPST